jgi:5-methylcytosine-specific restriction endonuclease McrA
VKAPIATKLAELRQAIVEIETRKSFTPAQRRAVFEAQSGQCSDCEEPLTGRWEIDHVISRAIGGRHEPSNWLGKCTSCHAAKTKADRKAQAKANRIIKRETEGAPVSSLKSRNEWPQGRKIQSRGFRRFIPTRTA